MSHGDKVTRLPNHFQVTAMTSTCPIAAMSDERRRFYGVQFHPEVTHTKSGLELLTNFVVKIVVVNVTGHQKISLKMPLLVLKHKWAMMK